MRTIVAAILSLVAFTCLTLAPAPLAHAAPQTLNANSYLDYATKTYDAYLGVNSTDWVALPGQPTKTFHRICITDDSGSTMQIGNGTSPSITVQLTYTGGTGASTRTTCFPFGLTYLGSSVSIWVRTLKSASSGGTGGATTSGHQVVNFLY